MKRKRIYILLGHSDCESLSGQLADEYEKGAKEAGHEIKRTNICDIKFDPILHKGYKSIQALEPDLIQVQEDMKWAEHVVISYPNWWGMMPAILKGLFDRMFLPGFAFKFQKNSWRWTKLLTGRSASVWITMNVQPMLAYMLFGDNSNEIKKNILGIRGGIKKKP